MMMNRLWIVALLLLVSCTVVDEPVNETVYKSQVVNTVKHNASEQVVKVSAETPALSANIPNIYEPDIIGLPVDETPVPKPVNLTVSEDLSLAQQHKMIPLLEDAVKASQCYKLTWEDIENQHTRWPLEVRKEMRFEYFGEKLFKGWIVYSLWISKDRLASETVAVMVDNLIVDCPDTNNFSIDWERVWAQRPMAPR